MLTQERLKEIAIYDPETGLFYWSRSRGSLAPIGKQIGWVSTKGYLKVTIDGVKYYLHRLAWLYTYGSFPKFTIDHINRITSDNRIVNLRDVTMDENRINSTRRINQAEYPSILKMKCFVCGSEFERKRHEYNRSIRDGRKFICSFKCVGIHSSNSKQHRKRK